jgi:hypothetical protein
VPARFWAKSAAQQPEVTRNTAKESFIIILMMLRSHKIS